MYPLEPTPVACLVSNNCRRNTCHRATASHHGWQFRASTAAFLYRQNYGERKGKITGLCLFAAASFKKYDAVFFIDLHHAPDRKIASSYLIFELACGKVVKIKMSPTIP